MRHAALLLGAALAACGPAPRHHVTVVEQPDTKTSAPIIKDDRPPTEGPPPTDWVVERPPPPPPAACSCAAACDCFGVNDPEREARRSAAAGACQRAGKPCHCRPCRAP